MAFVKITEQPSLYDNLEKKSVLEILQDINTEDQKVALAVKKAIPQIEKLVSQIVPRMKQGGRIFYMGAGTSGASRSTRRFGNSPNIRYAPDIGHRTNRRRRYSFTQSGRKRRRRHEPRLGRTERA